MPAISPLAVDDGSTPCVSSSMRSAEPVAVASVTALSWAVLAARRSWRRRCFTVR